MAETPQITYKSVVIQYDEWNDEWKFEVNGREKVATSLRLAKEGIDKAPKPRKPFERVEVWQSKGSRGFEKVFITSIAAVETNSRYSRGDEVWVSDEGQRSKRSASSLYPLSTFNNNKVAEIEEIDKQIADLMEKRAFKVQELDPYKIPEAE